MHSRAQAEVARRKEMFPTAEMVLQMNCIVRCEAMRDLDDTFNIDDIGGGCPSYGSRPLFNGRAGVTADRRSVWG